MNIYTHTIFSFANLIYIFVERRREVTNLGVLSLPVKIAVLLVAPHSCCLRESEARVAMAWDSGRRSGTLSHGKGRAQRARLEFRRFARSLGSIDRDSQFRVVGEAKDSSFSRPAAATGFCVPSEILPVLFLSPSVSHPLHFRSRRPAKYHPLATLIFHG